MNRRKPKAEPAEAQLAVALAAAIAADDGVAVAEALLALRDIVGAEEAKRISEALLAAVVGTTEAARLRGEEGQSRTYV